MGRFENKIDKIISDFEKLTRNVRVDILSAEYVSNIELNFGTKIKIKNLGSVSNKNNRTVVIQIWDLSSIKKIVKELDSKNLGLSITCSGNQIFLIAPPLSEERRMEIVSKFKEDLEDYKVRIRNVRRDVIKTNPELKNKIQDYVDSSICKLQEYYNLKQEIIIKG